MIKLNIKRAILAFEERTGEKMPNNKLAKLVWSGLSVGARNTRLSNLMTGKTKRIDLEVLKKLCKILGSDCNRMVGY